MPYFQKVEKDGQVSYVEVADAELQLPDNHPVVSELASVKSESIERRKEIKALKEKLETPAPATQQEQPREAAAPVTPTFDLNELANNAAKLAREAIQREQTAAEQAKQERQVAIDTALKTNGLDETYRPILEANPDHRTVEAQAKMLGERKLRFDQTPAGGNGQRDNNSLFKSVEEKLKLQP